MASWTRTWVYSLLSELETGVGDLRRRRNLPEYGSAPQNSEANGNEKQGQTFRVYRRFASSNLPEQRRQSIPLLLWLRTIFACIFFPLYDTCTRSCSVVAASRLMGWLRRRTLSCVVHSWLSSLKKSVCHQALLVYYHLQSLTMGSTTPTTANVPRLTGLSLTNLTYRLSQDPDKIHIKPQ